MNRSAPPRRPSPPPQRKRPSPSPAQRRKQQALRKKQRKKARQTFFIYAAATLAFYFLFVLLAVAVIWGKVHSFATVEVSEHHLFWADKEQNEFSSQLNGKLYEKQTLLEDGTLYVNTRLLSSYTSLSEGGNHLVRTLYLKDQEALFYLNTSTVCINGQYTSLSAPSIVKNGSLCVPLDFFTRCVTGLSVRTDQENDRYVVENTGEIGFAFHQPLPEAAIPYESYLNTVKPQ